MVLYDAIVIGSGPAGLTAAIYTTRANMKTLVIAGQVAGGQLMITTDVENYPGFPNGILGPELMELWRKQAERFHADFVDDNVTRVDLGHNPFKVWVEGDEYEGRTIIVATGANAKWLGLPSEESLKGKGVSACATCLPTGSEVVANAAPAAIESVQDGQMVLTDDGTFQPVVGTGSRLYTGDLIRIVPRFFHEAATLLTPEHPVLAATLDKGTEPNYWKWSWHRPQWVPAGSLTERHILLYPIVSKTEDVPSLKLSEFLGLPRDASGRVHFTREAVTSRRLIDDLPLNRDFMRLAGYFLADGTITARGFNLYFGPTDDAYVADATSIIRRLFGYTPTVKREGSVRRIECFAGILRDLFLKLFGKYSYGKSLPHWFLYLPAEKQAELVKGFWRGDGRTKALGFEFVTNSPLLVAQFKMIFLRLGMIPRIYRQSAEVLNRSKNLLNGRRIRFRHDRYQMGIGGAWLERASEVLGVKHPLLSRRTRSHAHGWIRDGYAYLPIFSLSRTQYSGRVHNLAVAKRNTYVTAGATVHNCDGFFFKGLDVMVVGGGDTAMEESLYLSKLCKSVTIVHRRGEFRASEIMQDRVLRTPNIKVIWDHTVDEVLGEKKVEGVRIKHVKTGAIQTLPVQGMFIAIGHTPATELFRGHLEMDANGYVIPRPTEDFRTATKIPGVFVAGDVHDHRYRQAVTAAGYGCMAALDAERWLRKHAGTAA